MDDIRITPEEEKLIPAWNEKWIKQILSTDPIDFDRAKVAIRNYHAACGQPGPEVCLRVNSAMIGIVGTAIGVAFYEKFGENGRFGKAPNIMPQLVEVINQYLPLEAWEKGIEWTNKFIADNGLAANYDIRKDAEKIKQRWPEWYNGGSEWGFHCCYMSFLRDIKNVPPKEPEKYQAYEELALCSGPRFDDTEFCLFSERAKVRHIEKIPDSENYRLHCDDGPAMAYHDGFNFWVIHGVTVDEQIVMRPETQTIQQIENEKDEETRRIRIERFGWERYLKEAGAQKLDSRRNERDAQEEVLYQLKTIKRFVCTDPSTGRRYALGVPDHVKSCEDAQNWMSHGLDRRAIHRS